VVAKDTVRANRGMFDRLTDLLLKEERVEGEKLHKLLSQVQAPPSLDEFVSHMYIRNSEKRIFGQDLPEKRIFGQGP
jgi:hypothetical protein